MSLFEKLYDKIEPLTKDQRIAKELADALVDAIESRDTRLVTKTDLDLAVSKLLSQIRTQTICMFVLLTTVMILVTRLYK